MSQEVVAAFDSDYFNPSFSQRSNQVFAANAG
jgi:hypothetical protein